MNVCKEKKNKIAKSDNLMDKYEIKWINYR